MNLSPIPRHRPLHFSLVLAVMVLLNAFWILPANAFDLQVAETIQITEPTSDDFQAIGGNITVDEPVNGDLLVIGGEVTVDAAVKGDMMVMAGQVVLNGAVTDDVRVVGGAVMINGMIGDDLIVRAGKVVIGPDAIVSGDVVIARGAYTEVFGTVQGSLYARGVRTVLNGEVLEDVFVRSMKLDFDGVVHGDTELSAQTLTVGSNAQFGGDVRYWQKGGTLDFDETAVSSAPVYDKTLTFRPSDLRLFGPFADRESFMPTLQWIYVLSGAAILLLLSLLFKGEGFDDMAQSIRRGATQQFLKGLLLVIITPVLVLLLMMSVIGIPIALLVLALYLFLLFISEILAALVLARVAKHRFQKQWSDGMMVCISLVFFVALMLVERVPVVGFLMVKIVVLMVLGGLVTLAQKRWE